MFFLNRFLRVFLLIVFSSSVAYGQAARVWVSGLGDDMFPCSRTAPCKTFAGALAKVADGGEIDALDPGGYGTVIVNKSVTIDGGGTLAGIANPGAAAGVYINAPSTATVTLRNLSIDGLGTGFIGVTVYGAGRVILDNLVITNYLTSNARGIDIANPSVTVDIRNCSISHINGIGIAADGVGGSARVTVEHSKIHHNSAFGVTAGYTTLTLIDTSVTQNVTGVSVAPQTGASVHIHGSSISQNRFGIVVGGPVALYGSQITGNEIAFLYGGDHTLTSHGNNAIIGNGDLGDITLVAVGLQ